MFRKKRKDKVPKEWDRENLVPIIRASICTGERTLGFREKNGERFTPILLVRKESDIDDFRKEWGVEEIKEEY